MLLNYSNAARDAGVSVKTIREYYQILEDTLIGRILPPWKKSSGRLLELFCGTDETTLTLDYSSWIVAIQGGAGNHHQGKPSGLRPNRKRQSRPPVLKQT